MAESLPPQFSLGLEDGQNDEVQPRRFMSLGRHLLAYGGDNGNVTCLLSSSAAAAAAKTTVNKFVIAKRYDEGIRAMAISKDGKRLAIGFETGETRIYVFDDYNNSDDQFYHPFIQHAMERHQKALSKKQDNNAMVIESLFQSQDVPVDDDDDLAGNFFLGPEFGTPIRDLQFLDDPSGDSSATTDYRLAVASEEGMCIVNATSFVKLSNTNHLLAREAREHHDNGGIRGLAMATQNSSNIIMASLAMDGRLCLWDLKEMQLLVRERLTCITKKDVGEIHDADAYDRSCRPLVWSSGKNSSFVVVGTPGNLTPVLRVWDDSKKILQELDGSAFDEAGIGHIDSIVAMLVCSDNLMVTSGRDRRLVVWQCQEGRADSSSTFLEQQWKAVERYELESPATDLRLRDGRTLYAACSKGQCQTLQLEKFWSCKNSSKTKSRNDAVNNDNNDVDFGTSERPETTTRIRFLDDEVDEDNDAPDGSAKKDATLTSSRFNNNDDVGVNDSFEASDMNADDNFLTDDGTAHQPMMSSIYDSCSMQRKAVPQEPFSPSETFPDNEDELRRFFCWNHVGSATILEGEDDVNTVDIHFTDSAFKKSISFTDGVGLILGSIGEEGGIFASGLPNMDDDEVNDDVNDADNFCGWKLSEQTKAAVRRDQKKSKEDVKDSEPKGSQVMFYKYDSLESKRFPIWSINLPDGEEVVGASCGIGWSAVITR
jgi:hypothetical protein